MPDPTQRIPAPDEPTQDDGWVELELVDRLVEDRMEGRLKRLVDYQDEYPGFEAAVARAWRQVTVQEAAQDSPSTIVGHWRLLNRLGRGGQATVWRAEDTRLRRQVALKMLENPVFRSSEALARFRREAEAASGLDHPAICTVLEAGEDDGVSWIAMQLVEGDTLRAHIAECRERGSRSLSITVADDAHRPAVTSHEQEATLRVSEEVARGVATAHEAGVIHRDLKPGNIMINRDGRPVVLDFGLARLEHDVARTLTLTGEVLGTPAYMAPEQLVGKPTDARTDVWALGVILHECLTLRRPFEGASFEALRERVLHHPLDVRGLREALPNDLVAVIEVALDKDPDRRYRSAGELAEDLARLRTRRPVMARPPGPALRTWRWTQRHPAIAASIMGVLLLVVTAIELQRRRFNEVSAERDLKDLHLSAWERLHDAETLRALLRQRDVLWPAVPEQVPAMDAWLTKARGVADRLQRHRDTYASLEGSALPYDDTARADDATENRRLLRHYADELAYREREQKLVEQGVITPPATHVDFLKKRIPFLRGELGLRRTWEFEDTGAVFRYRTLKEFLKTAEGLPDLIMEMEKRRAFAGTVHTRSIASHKELWDSVIQEVADTALSPEYGGLQLTPQVGLVPLGPDPDSGLQEFAHLQTGDVPERDPETGRLRFLRESGLVFVLIPGGTYRLGSVKPTSERPRGSPHVDHYGRDDESPDHEIELDPFFISKYEMTIAQWKRLTGNVPNFGKPGATLKGTAITWRNPVTKVSWFDAERVLFQLGLVLPTESQWEAACRGGTTTPYSWGEKRQDSGAYANSARRPGSDESDPDGKAWTTPVGALKPNPFGLHDIHGNVSEWCRDSWGGMEWAVPRVDREGTIMAPWMDAPRSHRGGDFTVHAGYTRSASRNAAWGQTVNEQMGIRATRRVDVRPSR